MQCPIPFLHIKRVKRNSDPVTTNHQPIGYSDDYSFIRFCEKYQTLPSGMSLKQFWLIITLLIFHPFHLYTFIIIQQFRSYCLPTHQFGHFNDLEFRFANLINPFTSVFGKTKFGLTTPAAKQSQINDLLQQKAKLDQIAQMLKSAPRNSIIMIKANSLKVQMAQVDAQLNALQRA